MWNSRGDELSLICDVGSASVGAGVVFFSKGQKPLFLSSATVPISIDNTPSPASEEKVLSLLDSILVTVVQNGIKEAKARKLSRKSIDKVFIVLSSPWHVSRSAKLTIEKPEPFEVTEDIVQSAIIVEEKKFQEKVLTGAFGNMRGESIKVIEREVVSVHLNGYRTLNPFHKKAAFAEIRVFMSVIQLSFFDRIQEMIKKSLHLQTVTFHTFPLSFFGAVSRLYPHEENMLLVDIGGESSGVSHVKSGALESSTSFPSGAHEVIRAIMAQYTVPEDVAMSYLGLIASGKGETEFIKTLEGALAGIKEEWLSQFNQSIHSLKSIQNIPHTCFLISKKGMSQIFAPILRNGSSHFRVVELDEKILEEHVVLSKKTDGNMFLSLEGLFLEYQDIHSKN